MENTPERWLADYDRDGYVVVEDCLDKATLSLLRSAMDVITSNPESPPKELARWVDFERDFVKNNPGFNDLKPEDVGWAIRNIMELPRFAPVFADLICYEPLLDVLETLFRSSEFSFHNYKCIIKAPKVSSRFCWHRDLPYLQHSTPNLLTAMLCLDDMTEENGATVVIPGTHRIPDGPADPRDLDVPESMLPDGPRVTVTCPAGSAVIFHVNILHGGGANRSEIPRRNVIGIWAGPDTYPVTAARYAYQDLMPRSKDAARIEQMKQSFPQSI